MFSLPIICGVYNYRIQPFYQNPPKMLYLNLYFRTMANYIFIFYLEKQNASQRE